MWEHAWGVLDALPDDVRARPEVLSRRLDVLIGLREWEKAWLLCEGLGRVVPQRADVWFRMACIQAQRGEAESARRAVGRCIQVDAEWRLRVLDEPMLADIW